MQTIQSRSPREFATLRWVPLFGQSSHRSDICPAVVNKWMRINSALISDVRPEIGKNYQNISESHFVSKSPA